MYTKAHQLTPEQQAKQLYEKATKSTSTEEALRHYKQSIQVSPSFDAYFQRAQLYLRQSQYNEALMDAKAMIALSPEDPDGHLTLSMALVKLKRMKEADEAYELGIELKKNFTYTPHT